MHGPTVQILHYEERTIQQSGGSVDGAGVVFVTERQKRSKGIGGREARDLLREKRRRRLSRARLSLPCSGKSSRARTFRRLSRASLNSFARENPSRKRAHDSRRSGIRGLEVRGSGIKLPNVTRWSGSRARSVCRCRNKDILERELE